MTQGNYSVGQYVTIAKGKAAQEKRREFQIQCIVSVMKGAKVSADVALEELKAENWDTGAAIKNLNFYK